MNIADSGPVVPNGTAAVAFTATPLLGGNPPVDPSTTPALETCSARFTVVVR